MSLHELGHVSYWSMMASSRIVAVSYMGLGGLQGSTYMAHVLVNVLLASLSFGDRKLHKSLRLT